MLHTLRTLFTAVVLIAVVVLAIAFWYVFLVIALIVTAYLVSVVAHSWNTVDEHSA